MLINVKSAVHTGALRDPGSLYSNNVNAIWSPLTAASSGETIQNIAQASETTCLQSCNDLRSVSCMA
ncbi:Protein of unknown function [Gryllus bimaculatus]|nr:Protein of unknown function [Gryllus bimaculatus]